MAPNEPLDYNSAGILDNTQMGLRGLLVWVNKTAAFRREGQAGRKVVDVGYFASVVDIGHGLSPALCTDDAGSKVLVAEMMQSDKTIAIDCVAPTVHA